MSREVRHVFLDMSKALDKVWREGLLFKIKNFTRYSILFKLLTSYLDKRKHRVLLNDWAIVEFGVPQGSVLGLLLFLIYINDLEKGIKSKINFFTDDTSLFSTVTDPTLTASELNHALKLIEQWAYLWKMSFNPNKQAIEVLVSIKSIHLYILHYILTAKKYAVPFIINTLALS